MHAEEDAGSRQVICRAYGLKLQIRIREGVPVEDTGRINAAFERFAEIREIRYADFQKELLRRIAQRLGLTQEVLDRKATNADHGRLDQSRQAKPKRRSRRRRARRR